MRRRASPRPAVLLLASLLIFTSILVHACIGLELGSITITASPTPITVGESTTISGSIAPSTVGETVTIWYRKIGNPWGVLINVTTNGTGQYSYVWTATKMGTYEFKATWIGETYAAESSVITVDVVGIHDIAIINIVRSPTEVKVGETVDIDVAVMNEGHYSETFDVIVKYHTVVIDTHSVTLASGATATEPFTWDTTGVTEGTYTISAEVPQVTGETDTTDNTRTDGTVKVTLPKEPPVASFTYSPDSPAVDETVTFDASASSDPDGTIDSYEWNFGDGTTDTVTVNHVDHAYADNGTYTVTLKVTDNDGLFDTTSKDITVPNTPPNATFTESKETVYTGEVVTFNASDSYDPDGNITSYFWDFGDGTDATETDPVTTHSYADNGNYTVTLTVTDDDGATHNATATKTVLNRPPVASFTQSAEIIYLNETTYFNASDSYDPDGNITSYWWNFGDGTNATGVTTEHSYPLEGNYTVTLTVTDDDGATNSTNASKTVLSRPPVAMFTESAEEVYTNETIYLNASESYDLDGDIVSYFWDFGDGTNVTGIAVEHTYMDDGNYTVTLTVTDDDGATATATANKTVLNRPPVAIFIESTETAYIDEPITFNASDSYDPDGTIASYSWDFGDGTNTTGAIANHAYEINGTFTVTLTVTDDDGASNSSSSTKTILKKKPPVPLFTESAETVYTSEIIAFNASDSYDLDGIIEDYLWDFGDGTNATGVTVDHSYADDGVYTVTLSVTDDDGETASKSAVKSILNRPPIALFTANATMVDVDEAIRFDASGSYDADGSIRSYFWDFGDGARAHMCVILDHIYTKNGNYTVTLTVTDDDGASSSISATVTVKTSTGWPLALIAGIAVGIAVSTGTAIYAIYGRKKEGPSKRDQST